MNLLFHIGYHKTATTWLQQRYFAHHSRLHLISDPVTPWDDPIVVYLVRTPEGNFDPAHARTLIEETVKKVGDVERDDVFVVSAERLSGHPASGGYDSLRIAERLHATAPEARVLCVIRDQVAMMESVYRQLVFEGFMGPPSALLAADYWKIPGPDPSFWEYNVLVGRYVELFGPERIFVARYEEFRASPVEFLQDLCGFLGVRSEPPRDPERVIGRRFPRASLGALRFLNHFRRTDYNPYPLLAFPEAARRGLVRVLRHLPDAGTVFSEREREAIRRRFVTANERLECMMAPDPLLPDKLR